MIWWPANTYGPRWSTVAWKSYKYMGDLSQHTTWAIYFSKIPKHKSRPHNSENLMDIHCVGDISTGWYLLWSHCSVRKGIWRSRWWWGVLASDHKSIHTHPWMWDVPRWHHIGGFTGITWLQCCTWHDSTRGERIFSSNHITRTLTYLSF